MSLNPMDLFDYLTPDPHASPIELNNWRNKIAFCITLLMLAMVGMAWAAERRYANAEEETKIHQTLNQSIASIADSVQRLTDGQAQLVKSDKARTIRDVREQILSIQDRACKSKDELREVLNGQVAKLRSQYMELVGEEFPILTCSDLLGK